MMERRDFPSEQFGLEFRATANCVDVAKWGVLNGLYVKQWIKGSSIPVAVFRWLPQATKQLLSPLQATSE